MSHVLKEGALEFTFDGRWHEPQKWDDTGEYTEGIQKLCSSKAVDFIALSKDQKQLLLLEVKDFRGHRIENKDRISTGDLFQEVALKSRDTIAGLIGAAHTCKQSCFATQFALALPKVEKLVVMLWMQEDGGFSPRELKEIKSRIGPPEKKLGKELRWLTPRPYICSLQLPERAKSLGLQVKPLFR